MAASGRGQLLVLVLVLSLTLQVSCFYTGVAFRPVSPRPTKQGVLQLRACTPNGKGFGKATQEPAKSAKSLGDDKSEEDQAAEMRALMGKTETDDASPPPKGFAADVKPEGAAEKQKAMQGRRAAPVNLDTGAMLDVNWVKDSIDVVRSDEWVKGGQEEENSGVDCPECGGSGRIQGGLGTLPGLKWWPIKAFRPCPTCEREGRTYTRRGQVLDEVLFGKDDMPMDYEKPAQAGLSSDDVKKIMSSSNRASRRGSKKSKK